MKASDEWCLNCGARAEHAHHVIPRSVAPSLVIALENLIPLCSGCHGGWHDRTVTLHRELFSDLQWSWIAERASEGWLDHWYPARETEMPF